MFAHQVNMSKNKLKMVKYNGQVENSYVTQNQNLYFIFILYIIYLALENKLCFYILISSYVIVSSNQWKIYKFLKIVNISQQLIFLGLKFV